MAGHKIDYGAKTNIGRRKNNEDKELAICLAPEAPDSYLLAVADGMGGGVAGEEASAIVISELEKFVRSKINEDTPKKNLKGLLGEAYIHVQEKIQEAIKENEDLAGMGTTLTALIVHKDHYVWGNIGDSRLYLLSAGGVKQLTIDHSHIQEMINRGEKPDMAYIRKYSNLITRSISGPVEEADIYPREPKNDETIPDANPVEPETALLLCSDGLLTFHPEEEINASIYKLYFSGKILDQAFDDLIQYAKDAGSRDNITVSAIEFGIEGRTALMDSEKKPGDNETTSPFAQKNRIVLNIRLRTQLAIIIPIVIIAGAALAAIIFSNPESKESNIIVEEEPCQWINQLDPNPIVSKQKKKLEIGSYTCPEDSARILLILNVPGKISSDTLVAENNKGLINMGMYRKSNLNDTLEASTYAILKDGTVIQGNSANILIR